MTVRLQSGALAVFSPTALTDEVKQKVAELGEVKYITALDIEVCTNQNSQQPAIGNYTCSMSVFRIESRANPSQHHIYLGPWHQAYPKAKVLGPEGLPEKRTAQKNEQVPFAHVFTKNNPITSVDPEFDAEFSYEYVYAHQNKEIVFLHKPTRTLIQADFIFNYPATEQYSKTGVSPTSGILTKIFGSLTNTKGSMQKRVIWYGISSGDRTGFSKSVKNIDGWDFDRIIPCHGDVIENNGKGVFQKVMEWHLKAKTA